jgi:hypothetical protein
VPLQRVAFVNLSLSFNQYNQKKHIVDVRRDNLKYSAVSIRSNVPLRNKSFDLHKVCQHCIMNGQLSRKSEAQWCDEDRATDEKEGDPPPKTGNRLLSRLGTLRTSDSMSLTGKQSRTIRVQPDAENLVSDRMTSFVFRGLTVRNVK